MAQYYVSSAGNDSNNGTSTGTPWLTIDKVNAVGLDAGDTVSFNGGDTFSGGLLVSPASPPTSSARITINSYGTGSFEIDCGDFYGVKVLDCGFVTISNLIVTGSGINVSGTNPPGKTATTTSADAGIRVETTTPSTWYSGLILDSVEVTGCLIGIHFVSTDTSATAAHENFRISRCNTHDCGIVGVMINGTGVTAYPHEHFGTCYRYGYIADNISSDNAGITAYDWGNPGAGPIQTGFGFFIANCLYTVIERCFSTNCGDASYNASPGGPCGIIFVECTSSTMRYCESSEIFATSGVDGEPFDLDGGCLNCVVEHCYGHDSDGPGILLFQFGSHSTHAGSIVRYNVFENCCRNNNQVYDENDGVGTPQCYHNTFYQESSGNAVVQGLATVFRNNIFVVNGGATFGNFGDTSVLTGNTYFAGAGSSFSLTQNSNTYTSLALMRADGLEVVGGVNAGASGDPLFINPGAGVTVMPDNQVSQLVNYDLGFGSPAKGAGVNLLQFSLTPPALDWHNNPAVANETATLSGIDSGAVRQGSTVIVGVVGVR